MRLRERLEIRALADTRYRAGGAELYQLLRLADRQGEDAVLDWLRAGLPTPGLDVTVLSDLLAAGVTERRFRWVTAAAGRR